MALLRGVSASVVLGCVLLGVAGALVACSSTTPVVLPKVINCVGAPSERPKALTLACADANIALTKITWRSWATTEALGNATLVENTCTPTCVAGKFVSFAAQVTLEHVRKVSGHPLFTAAVIRYHPSGKKDVVQTYPLVTGPLP